MRKISPCMASVGRDIDGLVEAPDHQSDGEGGVKADGDSFHWGNPVERFQCTRAEAGWSPSGDGAPELQMEASGAFGGGCDFQVLAQEQRRAKDGASIIRSHEAVCCQSSPAPSGRRSAGPRRQLRPNAAAVAQTAPGRCCPWRWPHCGADPGILRGGLASR